MSSTVNGTGASGLDMAPNELLLRMCIWSSYREDCCLTHPGGYGSTGAYSQPVRWRSVSLGGCRVSDETLSLFGPVSAESIGKGSLDLTGMSKLRVTGGGQYRILRAWYPGSASEYPKYPDGYPQSEEISATGVTIDGMNVAEFDVTQLPHHIVTHCTVQIGDTSETFIHSFVKTDGTTVDINNCLDFLG